MTFSVVIPVYNVEKFLEKCINSILNQTYKDFEIILVDDGSPDNSPKMCDDYAEKHSIIRVLHKPNGGLVSARKAGANIASGDYIVCVDSDDWVETTFLESFAKAIEDKDADIVCCELYQSDGITNVHIKFPLHEGYYNCKDIEKYIFPILIKDVNAGNFNNSLCTMAIKKELYLKYQNMVDEKICMGEDVAVVKPCVCEANSVYYIKKPLYYYRNNLSSMTRSKKVFDLHEPKLRGQHLERIINMNEFDFRDQNYRMVVNALFHVLKSQFNRKEKYSVIAKDIRNTLKDEYYQCAIKNCDFKYFKGRLTLLALKHRTIFLIWLFNKVKYL